MNDETMSWTLPIRGKHRCPNAPDYKIVYGEHNDGWRFTVHHQDGYESPIIGYCPFCGVKLPGPPAVILKEGD